MNIKIGKESDINVLFVDNGKKCPIGFNGKNGEIVSTNNTVLVGIKGIKNKEDWRVLGVKLTGYLMKSGIKDVNIAVPKKCGDFIEGIALGSYKFSYKTDKKKTKLKTIYVSSKSDIKNTVAESIKRAQATNFTRDWVNTPPEDANSMSIEQKVVSMFKGTDVNVSVYGEDILIKNGMNAHLAVNRASRHEAKTIKLTYEPKDYDKHHIFVGKGLTYDSGGLSIKPGQHMTTMKADKAGAMTVWGLMKYLSESKSTNKVTVYMGIAENMIDGSAYKPDDVLTAMNGKTIHIKNTDAEGRLVLFDNLCLAQKENKKFDTIHTLATLTGAAVYSFGDEVGALVGFNEKLKRQVKKTGEKSGELFTVTEFHKYMMDGVNDTIADLSNTGTAGMGCQKAGLFLTNAITKKNKNKYCHWDIAGPAFVDKAFGHNPAGGTGFGVRTLIDFVK